MRNIADQERLYNKQNIRIFLKAKRMEWAYVKWNYIWRPDGRPI